MKFTEAIIESVILNEVPHFNFEGDLEDLEVEKHKNWIPQIIKVFKEHPKKLVMKTMFDHIGAPMIITSFKEIWKKTSDANKKKYIKELPKEFLNKVGIK